MRPIRFAATIAGAALCASTTDAWSQGLMPSNGAELVEVKLALAVGPSQTAHWTELVLDGPGGDVGVVVPVQSGSHVEWGSQSFFEGLEIASATRVIAPTGLLVTCPGTSPPFVEDLSDKTVWPTLNPQEVSIVTGPDAVRSWALARGLTVSASLSAALDAQAAPHFVVARFLAPAGVSHTRPVRSVVQALEPTFALSLAEGGTQDVRVDLFAIGTHRAIIAMPAVDVDTSDLELDAAQLSSNYGDLLEQALTPGGVHVVTLSSHASLRDLASATSAGPSIDPVITTYYARAAVAGEATLAPGSCTGQAAVVLGQSARLGTTCPRATIGVAGGGAACTADTVLPGQVDPALVRCGPNADEMAVALSGLEPDEAWLTRGETRIVAGFPGTNADVSFPGGTVRIDPVIEATQLNLTGCGDGGGGAGGAGSGSGSGNGSGPGSGPGSGGPTGGTASAGGLVEVPVYALDGCGSWVITSYVEEEESSAPEAYYDESGDSCAGDTIDTYPTEGESFETAPVDDACAETVPGDGGETGLEDGCSCDDTTASGDVGDACGGDSSGGDACGGDTSGGDACGGDTASDSCAVKRVRRRSRMSPFFYGLLVVIVPLRRALRKPRPRSV